MRLPELRAAAALSAAAIVLSACSGATQSSSIGLPATSVAPQVVGLSGRGHLTAHPAQLPDGRVLYVGDFNNQAIEILKSQNHTWTNIGTITAVVDNPFDTWVDKLGNLYVSNAFPGGNVIEYNPSGNPISTYSSGLDEPLGVTTDRFGNVYVTDTTGTGTVSEYPQNYNSAFRCSLPQVSFGVAVDAGGDVFVTLNSTGQIVEYRKGLFRSSCIGTILPVTVPAPLGIAIDRQGNLVVCQLSLALPAVDIIAPPYTSVTGTLGSGWGLPQFVTIDKGGTKANVVDLYSEVKIVSYPGGTILTTLGSALGLSNPQSAVDSSNYVP